MSQTVIPSTTPLSVWKPYVALLTVYLIWGTTAGVIRIGAETIPPALLPCLRFILAGLLLVGFCRLQGEPWPDFKTLRTHCVIGLLLFFGGNAIIAWTVRYVETGFSGILVATTPFWMAWLSSLLPPREKISALSMSGIVIGFGGMLILLSPQLGRWQEISPVFWLCIAGLMLMTFCWSLGSIYARKHPTPTSLLLSVGLQNLFAGLLLIPVCWWTIPHGTAFHPSWQSVAALAYLVLLGTITATPCYLYVVKTMPVSVSSTFAYVTPLLTMVFGRLFLHETITPTMLWGGGVILTGVVLVQYFNRNWAQRKIAMEPEALEAVTNEEHRPSEVIPSSCRLEGASGS